MIRDIFTVNSARMLIIYLRSSGLTATVHKVHDTLVFTRKYRQRLRSAVPDSQSLDRQRAASFSYAPLISIIVPVYKTPDTFLRQMIDSVANQTYPHWELCLADGSADPEYSYIEDTIHSYQKKWPNIRYCKLEENLGIAGNTNTALQLASGDFIALLDHDDIIEPDALFEIVSAINKDPEIDVVYTDEDKVNLQLNSNYDPYFKPDYNPDLLRSCNYITHFYVARRSLLKSSGLFSDECNGSQDYDFILRTSELARRIAHVPKVLYHWRISKTSVAGNPTQKIYAYNSAVRALQNHLNRNQIRAEVSTDKQYGYYKIRYSLPDPLPRVSICMTSCSPDLESQIKAVSTYPADKLEFISSPAHASGDLIVMLYHVKSVINRDWLEPLVSNALRPETGAVSARSLLRKNRLMDMGLVFTPDGQLHSPFFRLNPSVTGYCFYAQIQRCVSLISPYCYAVKTADLHLFLKTDSFISKPWPLVLRYCLYAADNGKYIAVLPDSTVLCTRKRSSLPVVEDLKGKQDPYYNPNFSEKNMYQLP